MFYKLNNEFVTMNVQEENDVLMIQGKIIKPSLYEEMVVMAANPIDRMTNYSGSGLPFPCPSIAFENTPNFFKITDMETGNFQTTFKKPNSYYTEDTQTKVKPSVFLRLTKVSQAPTFIRLELEDNLPLRTLFYRKGRTGPEFYDRKAQALGVQGQEAILRQLEQVKVRYHCA